MGALLLESRRPAARFIRLGRQIYYIHVYIRARDFFDDPAWRARRHIKERRARDSSIVSSWKVVLFFFICEKRMKERDGASSKELANWRDLLVQAQKWLQKEPALPSTARGGQRMELTKTLASFSFGEFFLVFFDGSCVAYRSGRPNFVDPVLSLISLLGWGSTVVQCERRMGILSFLILID